MARKKEGLSRRDFLKSASVVTVGSLFAGAPAAWGISGEAVGKKEASSRVPERLLFKTGRGLKFKKTQKSLKLLPQCV